MSDARKRLKEASRAKPHARNGLTTFVLMLALLAIALTVLGGCEERTTVGAEVGKNRDAINYLAQRCANLEGQCNMLEKRIRRLEARDDR